MGFGRYWVFCFKNVSDDPKPYGLISIQFRDSGKSCNANNFENKENKNPGADYIF